MTKSSENKSDDFYTSLPTEETIPEYETYTEKIPNDNQLHTPIDITDLAKTLNEIHTTLNEFKSLYAAERAKKDEGIDVWSVLASMTVFFLGIGFMALTMIYLLK